jgi:hypothetical protein
MKKLVAALAILAAFVPGRVNASVFTLPTVDSTMTDPIFRTMASGFLFRSVEPASDLGKTWGLYFGADVTATSTSAVSNIMSGLSSGYLPTGNLQIGLGLPKGITLEFGFVPTFTYSGTTVATYGGDLKWTLSRALFPKLPINVAVALGYTSANLNYSQALDSGTVAVNYGTSMESAMLQASVSIGILFGLEPFAGVGVANANSTLSGTGTSSLFGSGFAAGTTSVSASNTSTWLQAGLLLRLGILGIAGEYDYVFGLSSYNIKTTFRF